MKPRKILMIDDEPDSIERVLLYLDPNSFALESTTDPLDGIEKAQKLIPDIIILDIDFPQMRGYEICKRLRSLESTRDIPIIIYSVHGDEDDAYIHGLDLGVYAVLHKGNLSRLAAAVERFIDPMGDRNANIVRYSRGKHELRILGKADRVWLDDKEVFLRPKTRKILSFLGDHPGITISSNELIEIAYSKDEVFGRVVEDIHRLMHDLREQVEPNPKKPIFIESKRRVGYRLMSDESLGSPES